jgi:hypothetical protein
MKQAIKWTFLLGILLILAGFVWHYLRRAKRESPKDEDDSHAPLPLDLQ